MRRSLLVIGLVLGLLPRPAVADMCGGFPELGGFLPMGLLQPPNTVFFSGCSKVYTLKLGASPGPDGNYILLDLPPCPSGPCARVSGASPPAARGQAHAVPLEFLAIAVTPARPTSWGHIKLLYR